jgi:hypothetical protein
MQHISVKLQFLEKEELWCYYDGATLFDKMTDGRAAAKGSAAPLLQLT